MKTTIFTFLIFFFLSSCNQYNEDEYINTLREVNVINDTSEYNYSILVEGVNKIDSSANSILLEIDSIENDKILEDYKNFSHLIQQYLFNDSIKRIFKEKLVLKNTSVDTIETKVKNSRSLFLNCVLNYMKRTETDPSFIQPLLFPYMTKEGNSVYFAIDISIPTSYKENKEVVILSDSLQYASLKNGDLSLRKIKTDYKDSIYVELIWYDKKAKDTIRSEILYFN